MTARRRLDLEEAAIKEDASALEELAGLPGLTAAQREQRRQAGLANGRCVRELHGRAAAGDRRAAAQIKRWRGARAAANRAARGTPGVTVGRDGRYRAVQLPGRSWGTRQGVWSALKRHVKTTNKTTGKK